MFPVEEAYLIARMEGLVVSRSRHRDRTRDRLIQPKHERKDRVDHGKSLESRH